MKTEFTPKIFLALLVATFVFFTSCGGEGTETCNPTGSSCPSSTASPSSDGDSTSSENSECTDDNNDGLDDSTGETCSTTTDAAVSAIIKFILQPENGGRNEKI